MPGIIANDYHVYFIICAKCCYFVLQQTKTPTATYCTTLITIVYRYTRERLRVWTECQHIDNTIPQL